MVNQLKPLSPELAKALDLGREGLMAIGYWRDDPSTDPELTPSAARARQLRERLASGRSSGRVYTGDRTYTGEEYAAKRIAELGAEAELWAQLPWPGDHVDPDMGTRERERVAKALDGALDVGGFCGSSYDRLDPDHAVNGSRERSAGGYIWPSGLSTYVLKYGLRLDPEFLAAIGAA